MAVPTYRYSTAMATTELTHKATCRKPHLVHMLRERGYTSRPIEKMRIKDLVQALIETDAGHTEDEDDRDDGDDDDEAPNARPHRRYQAPGKPCSPILQRNPSLNLLIKSYFHPLISFVRYKTTPRSTSPKTIVFPSSRLL